MMLKQLLFTVALWNCIAHASSCPDPFLRKGSGHETMLMHVDTNPLAHATALGFDCNSGIFN